jgi:hypothetical protein
MGQQVRLDQLRANQTERRTIFANGKLFLQITKQANPRKTKKGRRESISRGGRKKLLSYSPFWLLESV